MDIRQFLNSSKTIPKVGFLDPLTKIPNRYFFENCLKETGDNRPKIPIFSIYLIDLDYFKEINDLYGYAVGDKILCQVANRLSKLASSEEGIVIRLGGDEFILLIDKVTNAKEFAQKIICSVSNVFLIDKIQYDLNASVGYIANQTEMFLCTSLIKKMEFSLRLAKRSGGNQSIGFDNKVQNIPFINSLHNDLKSQQINFKEFHIVYQAQFNDKKILRGVEGSLRWNHPILGELTPMDFLHLIYDHNNILIFGDFVLNKTFEALKNLKNKNHSNQVSLTINISPIYFQQDKCSELLEKYLEKNDAKSPRLIIEFSAKELPKNLSKFRVKMFKFAEMGIKFSLEDINIAEISLNELLTLPINQMKIDAQILARKESSSIIKSILSISTILNIPLIGKNIESDLQFNTFLALGVCIFQGNLFGPTKSITSFLTCNEFNCL